MSGHGGRRSGSGRKRGSVNRMTQRAREEASKTGELPHEFLLRVMRGNKISGHRPTFAERLDAAKAAAPFYAPRLAAIAANVKPSMDPVKELLEAIHERARLKVKS